MDSDTTVVERDAMTRGGGLSVRDLLAKRLGTSLALLGIIAGALLLRLHNLDQWGLWDDELFTVQHALEPSTSSAGTPWRGCRTGSGSNSPGSTWRASIPNRSGPGGRPASPSGPCGHPWRCSGRSRSLVLWFVGRRTLGVRPTLWLCLLLALSPWHLWMSQVCRFYMQLFLLYNLALLLYYQATMEGSLARAGAAMACMVLAFYTSQIALMIVGCSGSISP